MEYCHTIILELYRKAVLQFTLSACGQETLTEPHFSYVKFFQPTVSVELSGMFLTFINSRLETHSCVDRQIVINSRRTLQQAIGDGFDRGNSAGGQKNL